MKTFLQEFYHAEILTDLIFKLFSLEKSIMFIFRGENIPAVVLSISDFDVTVVRNIQ